MPARVFLVTREILTKDAGQNVSWTLTAHRAELAPILSVSIRVQARVELTPSATLSITELLALVIPVIPEIRIDIALFSQLVSRGYANFKA